MSRKLRIAVWHNLPSGGGKRALFYHVRGLAQRGHAIECWSPPLADSTFSALSDFASEHVVPLDILPEGRNYIEKIIRHVRRPRLLMKAMEAHCRRCAAEIDEGAFDVLFANTDMYFSMPYVGRYTTLPKLVYLGEPHRPFYEALPELPWIDLPAVARTSWSPKGVRRRARHYFDTRLVARQAREELESARSFDAILVNSLFSRESVLKAYGLDARVCYLGIDSAKFRPSGLSRQPFLIGLGTIGPSKNVELAIKGVAASKTRPRLVWVGNMTDDLYVARMTQLSAELGVDFEPRVLISDEELVGLLGSASAMIYTPRLEPFGLAPLEANSCECPVIGVAEGGVRETVVDRVNGLLTLSDPAPLGDAIDELMNDRPLRDRLGVEARRLVECQWSLDACVDRVEGELLRLVT